MFWYRIAPQTRHRVVLILTVIVAAGLLGFVFGYWYGQYTYVPLAEQSLPKSGIVEYFAEP